MRVKTHTLTGKALDWAVAKATWGKNIPVLSSKFMDNYNPSTSLEQGYALILKYKVSLVYDKWLDEWEAWLEPNAGKASHRGSLVAAMQALVWYYLGDEVGVPDWLVEEGYE